MQLSIRPWMMAVALAVGLLGMGAQPAAAQTKVLFLGQEDIDVSAVKTDILGADSRFDLVGSTALTGLPTLTQLQQYDSVLVWTNGPPTTGLGARLADYVDAGGGVVLATFDGQYETLVPDWANSRINSAGYNPLTNPTFQAYQSATLGAYDATHPLMAGVSSLDSTDYNGDYLSGLDSGATLAASWSNGRPLAAVNATGNVATITLFPNVAEYGHASGDYRPLFRNALLYTAGDFDAPVSSVPEPASLALVLPGLGALALLKRRKQPSA